MWLYTPKICVPVCGLVWWSFGVYKNLSSLSFFACVIFLVFFYRALIFSPTVCTLRLLFKALKEQTKELNTLADVPHFMAC